MSAAELRRMAAEAEAEERTVTLAQVCRAVGIGMGEVLGKGRSARVARHRAVVAWALVQRGWTVKQAALALKRTERQTFRMLRNLAVTSG